ncbi:MAG: Zn-dependent hydrolase [Bacteroidales bacterium]
MYKKFITPVLALGILAGVNSCEPKAEAPKQDKVEQAQAQSSPEMQKKLDQYAKVQLTSNIDHLSANQKEMLKVLFQASDIMNAVYWKQSLCNEQPFVKSLSYDPAAQEFAKINYGPWDRLNDNLPFLCYCGSKPAGANFYPLDMTKEEFENWNEPNKTSLYSIVRRDNNGNLKNIPYSEAYKEEFQKAAELLRKAATLAENDGFKKYLNLRADALLSNDYYESDLAWLDMKDNLIDLVYGPIENYEDQLFGYRAACEAFILVKDVEWSNKLQRFAKFIPQLQKDLPVAEKYKKDPVGSETDLGAYDAVYYAGDCNAAGKTLAINLPNDERVHKAKGTRRLQLKNSMKAKFDKILVPISEVLITPDQRKNISFDAFFANTMFHEVAHGMGIKETITGKGPVRTALKEQYSAIEEGKADILGLYLVTKLNEMGEFPEANLLDNYVTFMAGIFRSVRFGAASAHGKANMIRFNYFLKKGAFTRNDDGTYAVNFEKMKTAATELTQDIIRIQGDGDYAAAAKWVKEEGNVSSQLEADLARLAKAGIPKDIVFEQGPAQIGL